VALEDREPAIATPPTAPTTNASATTSQRARIRRTRQFSLELAGRGDGAGLGQPALGLAHYIVGQRPVGGNGKVVA